MALLDNILTALDHWTEWKKIKEAPDKLVALELRLADLESRLVRRPFDECPKCHALEFRVQTAVAVGMKANLQRRQMKCQECGHYELWTLDPVQGTRR